MSLKTIAPEDLELASGGDGVRTGSIRAGQAFGATAAVLTGNGGNAGPAAQLGGAVMGAANSAGSWAGEKLGSWLYPKSLPAPSKK